MNKVSGETSCSILANNSILSGDNSEYASIIGIAVIHCMVIKDVNSHEYIAIDLTSLMVTMFEIASDHSPPTF